MGDLGLVDTMIKDGLTDVFNGYHMGITAENLAEQYQVTRDDQDAFATASQNKASAARAEGRFKDEIAAVTVKSRKGETDRRDRRIYPRRRRAVRPLRPPPRLQEGRHRHRRQRLGPQRRRRRARADEPRGSRAPRRADPRPRRELGLAPASIPRSWASARSRRRSKALEKAGWTIADLDLIEANEAFAAQALAVGKELGWDADKVNVNGGAIAIGHPIGASGARVLTTLLYEMQKRDAKKGLATLCIGGGMGIALCVERD